MILKVIPVLPLAEAAMLPLEAPGPVVWATVPLTVIVTPLHGFVGPPPPPLLPHDKRIVIKAVKMNIESKFIFLITALIVTTVFQAA